MVNTVRERKYKVRMKPFNTRSPGCSNRIAKKRGTDKVKAVLPATPSKKAAIIKTIVNSPRTRTILEDEGMMKTLTDEMEPRALKALASDISDGLQDVKKARSNKKRAAFTAFKSLAFGKNVKKAKVKKSLSKIVNIHAGLVPGRNLPSCACRVTAVFNVAVEFFSKWPL